MELAFPSPLNLGQNFNGSILKKDDQYYFAWRHVPNNFYYSFLYWAKLNKDFSFQEDTVKQITLNHWVYPDDHKHEDPRLFEYKNNIYCSFINYSNKQSCGNQGIINLKTENVWFPNIGHNHNAAIVKYQSRTKEVATGIHIKIKPTPLTEKNWGFLSKENDLYIVYQTNPLQVYRGSDLKLIKDSYNPREIWTHGYISGGTPFYKEDYGYICFFHSYTKNIQAFRDYHMGAIVLDDDFNITQISSEPLLSGDVASGIVNHKVVFPCGAIKERDKWFISYGYNDVTTKIFELDEKKLLTNLKPYVK